MDTFSVGTVLTKGMNIWMRNFVAFTLITAVMYLPRILWSVFWPFTPLDYGAVLGSTGLVMVLQSFASAIITFGVVKELQGTPASLGETIGQGFKRGFPALLVAIVAGFAVGGATLLLVFPGFIVMCMLYVSTAASVVEKPGILGALRRSRALTNGHKWAVFGLHLVVGTLSGTAGGIAQVVVKPHDRDGFLLLGYINLASAVVFGALGAVMSAVCYFELRAEKEGTSVTQLAAVFE